MDVNIEMNECLANVDNILSQRQQQIPCIFILKIRSAWGDPFLKKLAQFYFQNLYLSYTLDMSARSRDMVIIHSIQLTILPIDHSTHTRIVEVVNGWTQNMNWKRTTQIHIRLLHTESGLLMFLLLTIDVAEQDVIDDACRLLLNMFSPSLIRRILYIVKPLNSDDKVLYGEIKVASDEDPAAVLRRMEKNQFTGLKGVLLLHDMCFKSERSKTELVEVCAQPGKGFHVVSKSSMPKDVRKRNRQLVNSWKIKKEVSVKDLRLYNKGTAPDNDKTKIGCEAAMMEDPLASSRQHAVKIGSPEEMLLVNLMYWLRHQVLELPGMNADMALRLLMSHPTDFYERSGTKGWKRKAFTSKTELLTWLSDIESRDESLLVDWPVTNEQSGLVLATKQQLEHIESEFGPSSCYLKVMPDEAEPYGAEIPAPAMSSASGSAEAMFIWQEIEEKNAEAKKKNTGERGASYRVAAYAGRSVGESQ